MPHLQNLQKLWPNVKDPKTNGNFSKSPILRELPTNSFCKYFPAETLSVPPVNKLTSISRGADNNDHRHLLELNQSKISIHHSRPHPQFPSGFWVEIQAISTIISPLQARTSTPLACSRWKIGKIHRRARARCALLPECPRMILRSSQDDGSSSTEQLRAVYMVRKKVVVQRGG